VLRCSEIIISI